jgi:hypothetical protein
LGKTPAYTHTIVSASVLWLENPQNIKFYFWTIKKPSTALLAIDGNDTNPTNTRHNRAQVFSTVLGFF